MRRLRPEQRLSQQALAARLGISASYLNLIEHDQRARHRLAADQAGRDAAGRSRRRCPAREERQLEVGLREAFADPLLGAEAVPEAEIAALAAGSPNAARAVLALYRAWRVAREDAGGIALPSGRRILLPNEEARDFFDDRANHFPALEAAAEALAARTAPVAPAEMNHAIAERLRRVHGLTVTVQPLEGALRRYDPATRGLTLSETLPRESRGFHMAFQLALLEAREAVEAVLAEMPRRPRRRPAMLIRIGLLNYVAGALLMPYAAFLDGGARAAARHGGAGGALRRVVRAGVPSAVHVAAAGRARACRSSSCASIRPATCRSGSRPPGFRSPATAGRARAGWCTRRSRTPGEVQVQVAELPDGAAYPVLRARGHAAVARLGRAAAGARRGDGLRVAHAERRGLCRRHRPGARARWASGCRAGCATGRIAAAARFRRWSIGWRWIRIPPARRRIGSRRGGGDGPLVRLALRRRRLPPKPGKLGAAGIGQSRQPDLHRLPDDNRDQETWAASASIR